MAIVPDNSEIIDNSRGTASSVLIRDRETKKLCLPGVPIALIHIFNKHILTIINDEHKPT